MNTLGLFVKQPVAGKVKTRLAAEFGDRRAAAVYEAFVLDLADRFRATGARRLLCYTPDSDSARDYFKGIAGESWDVWLQPDGHLGVRMRECIEQHLNQAGDAVALIGSDSPTLPLAYVEDAFMRLASVDCVLGPACDGGYYLLGLSRPCPELFSDVAWSTAAVLEQTVARLEQAGLSLAVLPVWYDVDTLDDWKLLAGHLRALEIAGEPARCPRTQRLARWNVESGGGSL